jgi:hypothetical protein
MRQRTRELLGFGWVIVTGLAVFFPMFRHGGALTNNGLVLYGPGGHPGVEHGFLQSADQSFLFAPWTNLAWQQVHSAHLPLWNPYSALGMPLAFNWESAVFSPQAILGYLAPLRYAYTTSIVATLLIAGSGTYVFCRAVKVGVLGAALAGTVYELSGAFTGLLIWPVAGVLCWIGWLLAATIWIVRGKHRVASIAVFAVVLASAGFGGQPEALFFLGIAMALFLCGTFVARALVSGDHSIHWRPLADVSIATICGAALFAPLWLPGLQVAMRSVRTRWQPVDDVSLAHMYLPGKHLAEALSVHDLTHVIFSRFDGFPSGGSQWFADRSIYFDSAAYVGIIVVVLALLAVIARRRNPVVVGLAVLVIGAGALVFVEPLISVLDLIPKVNGLLWNRALVPMGFGIAVLAGFGLDLVVRRHDQRGVRRTFVVTAAGGAVFLVILWLVGRGHLPSAEAIVRSQSFIWPAISALLILTFALVLAAFYRRGRAVRPRIARRLVLGGAGAILICETAFLVTAGAPLFPSNAQGLVPNAEDKALIRAVGSSLLGLGTSNCLFPPALGLRENLNVGFHVQELAVYDPMTPLSYFTQWTATTGQPGGYLSPNIYCPSVTSVALAHLYGVGMIVEPGNTPGPEGTTFVARVGNESLYRVPGAARATLTALGATQRLPLPDASGRAVPVRHPSPAQWDVTTNTSTPQVLRLRLTNLPGWRAQIDGRSLALHPFDGIMLQAVVPAGHHEIEIEYWPKSFSVGILLALCSAGALTIAGARLLVRRRSQSSTPPGDVPDMQEKVDSEDASAMADTPLLQAGRRG